MSDIKDIGSKVSAGAKIVRAILELFKIAPKKGPQVDKLGPRK